MEAAAEAGFTSNRSAPPPFWFCWGWWCPGSGVWWGSVLPSHKACPPPSVCSSSVAVLQREPRQHLQAVKCRMRRSTCDGCLPELVSPSPSLFAAAPTALQHTPGTSGRSPGSCGPAHTPTRQFGLLTSSPAKKQTNKKKHRMNQSQRRMFQFRDSEGVSSPWADFCAAQISASPPSEGSLLCW